MKLKLNIYYRIIWITSLLFSLYCFLFNGDNKNLKIIGYIIVTINLIIMAFLIQKQKRENQGKPKETKKEGKINKKEVEESWKYQQDKSKKGSFFANIGES